MSASFQQRLLFSTAIIFFLVVSTGVKGDAARQPAGTLPQFVNAYVQGIEIFKPRLLELLQYIETEDVWDDPAKNQQDIYLPENIAGITFSLQNLNADLQRAVSLIEPFTGAKNEYISKAAGTMQQAYKDFISKNEISVTTLQAFAADPKLNERGEELQEFGYQIEDAVSAFSAALYETAIQITAVEFPQQEREGIL